jgi:hypothetical protein
MSVKRCMYRTVTKNMAEPDGTWVIEYSAVQRHDLRVLPRKCDRTFYISDGDIYLGN